ncbi:helix-turn-helix domain-containing protein [Baekduia soli]|uniref:Helix-turn-helix domain-containing protein n=1 Tax=Baekduia soli TaxID=496014 RepID=A0A5B8U2V6_9ACTN|nr:helix-turn-helix domain-containing protein [Baekduia soli]QEC47300.1 helix-turn-helix domain-containing protein [Baekduia soli]
MPTPTHFDETIAVSVNLTEPLLTADQVADLLAVPRSSVYEYARRAHNPLPSIGVGRHRRFYRSDVGTWLASMRS